MKKSNKTTFLYIFSSVSLFLVLLFGGAYGVYISVGMSFVRRGISNVTEGGATNVSFGGMVNFESSMIGVIILSVALIIISIFDFISLIKQITFFKQFGIVKDSNLAQGIEKKSKGKGKIIFFAVLIDIISLIAGILGIFLNIRTFPNGMGVWVIYLIDGLIAVLSVSSIVLLLIKLKKLKSKNFDFNKDKKKKLNEKSENLQIESFEKKVDLNINEIEYKLLKLKQLKSSKIITNEEYENLRRIVLSNSSFETEKIIEK